LVTTAPRFAILTQIMERFPKVARPDSDIEEMRELANSGVADENPRNGYLLIVAVTTLLAKYATADFDLSDGEARRNLSVRTQRLAELFARLASAAPYSVASQFDIACWRQRAALAGRR
jgi:hypothetical protein